MAASLVKFSNRNKSGDRNLYWDRVQAGADNLPYRGAYAPMYKDEEYEQRTVKVADARNGFFDVTIPGENKQYLDILECCFNGWFCLVHLERFWAGPDGLRTNRHYVEWVEYYLEDGSRTPFHHPGQMELASGQQNVLGNSSAG